MWPVLYVWVRPNDPQLFMSVFMLSNGPLAWATIAFNHSLIFHSYPHISSLFIHISPMLLTYGLRWMVRPTLIREGCSCRQ